MKRRRTPRLKASWKNPSAYMRTFPRSSRRSSACATATTRSRRPRISLFSGTYLHVLRQGSSAKDRQAIRHVHGFVGVTTLAILGKKLRDSDPLPAKRRAASGKFSAISFKAFLSRRPSAALNLREPNAVPFITISTERNKQGENCRQRSLLLLVSSQYSI